MNQPCSLTDSPAWDHTFDVVVVGSGAAAFATALAANDKGLSPLMIESTDQWGGSTSMSGGGMWLPDNLLMQRDQVADSPEDALAYLDATVGDEAPASTPERKKAFVESVNDFVALAEKHGMTFKRAAEYPDYYPERPGGKIGRSIEHALYDAKRLDEELWATCRGRTSGVAFPLMTGDVWMLSRAWSTPDGFSYGARFVFRALYTLLRRRRAVGCGVALIGSFAEAVVQKLGVPLWLNSPLEELIIEDGRVIGVQVTRDGTRLRIRAEKGVMLASGGFDHNPQMRQEHQDTPGFSSGNPGNLGHPIQLAEAAGAELSLMDDAWWGGSVPAPGEGGSPSFIVAERSLPYSIMVDAEGNRFANESESYVDLGHHMRDHHVKGDFWLVADARHGRRYLRTFAMDPKNNKAMRKNGIMVKAGTLAELEEKLNIPAGHLQATAERFNGFARSGIDQDFERGRSAYDRYYGDPTVYPNNNLGTIEQGPFVAFKVVAGDLGTKGGVVTDEHSRALRADGAVIEGLYAAGNASASPMGRTYPGPGSTIAPACVFGLRASHHMAGALVAEPSASLG